VTAQAMMARYTFRMQKTMRQADYPLLEFDAIHKAVLEPTVLFPLLRAPKHAFSYLALR